MNVFYCSITAYNGVKFDGDFDADCKWYLNCLGLSAALLYFP